MAYTLKPDTARATADNQAAELNQLHQFMREAFNLEELRELCFDLAIDYEDLGEGLGKSDRILALIYYVVHKGRQEALLDALIRQRPHVKWPSPLALRHPLPNVPGTVVAGRTAFAVNVNYGTIVYQEATPQVRSRGIRPQPPRAPRGFTGRAHELAQLEQLIAANEPVLVFGPDGIGKSTLIKQAVQSQIARTLPDGVLFLEGVDENGVALGPGDVIQRLFDALFESEPPLKVNAVAARTYLSNTRPLVLLDRLSLSGEALSALCDLFPQSPLLLAAAMRPSGDVAELVRLGPLPRKDAVQLLVARAGITAGESLHTRLEAICDLLGGVPLAIVTTANTIRENNLSFDQAWERLSAYSPALSDSVEAAVERAYALAYATLPQAERHMLAAAAALPGVSVDKAWLERVAGSQAAGERLQALELLRANSPRLRLPPGLRRIALRDVDETAVREELLAFIHQALATGTFDFAFCEDELGNVLGLLEWAVRQQRWTDAIELGRAIDPYLALRGLWDAWRRVLEHVLAAARALGDRATEAWALHELGTRALGMEERDLAIDYLRQALDLRRNLGDTTGVAYTQHNLDFLIPPPPPSSPQTPSLPGGGVPLTKALPLVIALLAGIILIAIVLLGRSPLFTVAITPTSLALSTRIDTATNAEIPVSPTLAPSLPAVSVATVATNAAATPEPGATPESTPVPAITTDTSPPPGAWLITFFSNRNSGDDYQIYLINADDVLQGRGSPDAIRLTDSGFFYNPVLSPDGTHIAFVSGLEGQHEIHVVNADGTGQSRLTSDDDFGPVWSPDSSRIAFTSNRDGNAEIYVMNADGSEQVRLTNNSNYDAGPDWSPDGTRIAFTSNSDNGSDIYVVNADGSRPANLTSSPGNSNYAPAWSPDGRRIVFTSMRDGNAEVYVMNSDGEGLTNLTNHRAADYSHSWSPDSTQIAFLSDRNRETDHFYDVDLFVMNSDGSATAQVFDFRSPRSSCDYIFGSFVWSPDDRRIAFDYDSEIYAVNLDDAGLINLTNNPASDAFTLPGGC